jgi:P27 family predicted phage terminase small subunit
MNRSGPTKKPSPLKVLQGSYRPDRAPAPEPQLPNVLPPMPAHLTGEAKAEWERVSDDLFRAGLLKSVDRAALAAYCEAWALYVAASQELAALGGSRASQKSLFLFNLQKKAAELMYRYMTEFGMTPASRSRIEVKQPKIQAPPSRWEEFGA